MRVASLDLGSNTFLLLIADMEGRELKRVLADESEVTRLGQQMQERKSFHPEALKRADRCLAKYASLIEKYRCERVIAVATSAARDASNKDELFQVGKKWGIPIQVITGQREAALTFGGALVDLSVMAPVAVIDVGGGSTEVIGSADLVHLVGCSVDVGSVRLTEMHLRNHPCSKQELGALEEHVRLSFAEQAGGFPISSQAIVAVAGTPTTLAALDQKRAFQEEHVHGYKLSLQKIWQWRDRLAAMTVAERLALPGMQANRADVIVAGLTILAQAVTALKGDEVIVSTKGVRYGVAQAWQEFT